MRSSTMANQKQLDAIDIRYMPGIGVFIEKSQPTSLTEHPFTRIPAAQRSQDAIPRKQPMRRQPKSPPPPPERKVINRFPVKVIHRPKAEIDAVFAEALEKDDQTARCLIGDDAV